MIGTLSIRHCKQVLKANFIGRIGCSDGNRTYVVPVQYAFDGRNIFSHSVEGMKIHMMRKNPDICFEVDEIQDITNWKSVLVWGRYQEIKSEHERFAILKLFVENNIHLKTSETSLPPQVKLDDTLQLRLSNMKPVFYRIVVEEITGRFEIT